MLELASLSYRFQCVAKIGTIGVNIWWFLLFISFSPSKGSKIKIYRKKIIDAVWKQKGGIS